MTEAATLRPHEKLLIGIGLVVFAAVAIAICFRMPVFHPLDEAYHFDYVLKLARHGWATPLQRLEPDVFAMQHERLRANKAYYLNLTVPEERVESEFIPESYQAYHPPLFYLLGAAVVRGGDALGLSPVREVYALRVLCALMVVGAQWLVFLGLLRTGGRAVALAALPCLLFMVPVDLLRVSNDALAVLLGAAIFYGLARGLPKADEADGLGAGARRGTWGRPMLLGLGVALAVATKVNAVLFLMPSLALCMAFQAKSLRWRAPQAALVFAPAVVLGVVMAALNYAATRDLTGTAHLANANFPRPPGFTLWKLIPTAESWLEFHTVCLLNETMLHGARGAALYPQARLVTVEQLGLLAALGLAAFGASPRRMTRLGWSESGEDRLRRWILAAWASLLVMQAVAGALWFALGRAFWSMRQFMPAEFMFVLPAAAGWAYLLAIEGKRGKALRRLAWLGAAGLFALATRPYLMR